MQEGAIAMLPTLVLMFVGALVSGWLPFVMRVRESHLQTMSALGGGLLIGSALAVIVPEGFHAYAEANAASHHHDHDHSAHGHDHSSHAEEGGLPEGLAGLVLVGGFLLMLLLDSLQAAAGGGHHHHHGHSHGPSCSVPAASSAAAADDKLRKDNGGAASAAAAAPAAGKDKAGGGKGGKLGKDAASATAGSGSGPDTQGAITGLLIHCAADGLAMGAAALSGNARLSLIIGAAMVLHKAPMAFGLSAYLISAGWSWQRSQRTLLAFSAAAPLASVATYCLLGSLTFLTSHAAVALCIIFSGGTFLYAATMHILPEVLGSGGGHGSGRLSSAQLLAVTAGSLLPVALSWGHHH